MADRRHHRAARGRAAGGRRLSERRPASGLAAGPRHGLASLVCALALALAGTAAVGQTRSPSAPQSPNYRLDIDAPAELVDALRAQTLLGRWRTDPAFEPGQLALFLARARDEAEAIARAAGFFSATVDVTQEGEEEGLPVLRIRIVAGARTTVGGLRFVVSGVDDDTVRALASAWPLPEGSFFRTGEWDLGKRQLIEQLQQLGHVRARIVDSRAEVDPELTAARLTVIVEAGPRLRFGALSVRGLSRYAPSLVAQSVTWREGDPYAFSRLQAFEDRLRAERWFTTVSVLPDLAAVEADPDTMSVPVLVDLREREASGVGVGVGYSTDQGPRGLLGYEHRNVLGRGWVFESGALLEQVRRRIFATLTTPWDASGHRWQSGARTERFDVSGELTDKRTVYVGLGRRSEAIESFLSIQYQTEQRIVDLGADSATDRSAALTPGYAWSLRRLDSRVDPRDGHALSLQVSGASSRVASDRDFLRGWGRGMRFWKMPAGSALHGGTLIGLVEVGMVAADARDRIPSDNLFRAGGAQSVRGHSYLGLGVRQGDAVVGGRVLAIGSVEYQHPIAEDWSSAVFLDIGDAADRWGDWRPMRGTGVGLRWRSPVGPVHLDLARGSGDGADSRWRLHFSVGYGF